MVSKQFCPHHPHLFSWQWFLRKQVLSLLSLNLKSSSTKKVWTLVLYKPYCTRKTKKKKNQEGLRTFLVTPLASGDRSPTHAEPLSGFRLLNWCRRTKQLSGYRLLNNRHAASLHQSYWRVPYSKISLRYLFFYYF